MAAGSNPVVSIVVTSFNYERFVGNAIASALAQSYAPLEVVVVDDGSTDRSRDIIAGFGDRIRRVFQANAGETAAAYAGFAAARGDIVIFLDSDDLLRPNAAAAVVAAWRPGLSALQWQMQPIDAEGRPFGEIFPRFPFARTPAGVRAEALSCGLYACPPTSGCAYARAFLSRLMPLPTDCFRHGPDGPINAVAPLYGDVETLARPLSFYRMHGRNMWAQSSLRPERFAEYIVVDQKRVAFFRRHAAAMGIDLPEDLHDRGLFHLQYRMASLKLRPQTHPVASDTVMRLLAKAWRAARHSPDMPASRVAVLVWLAALGLAPLPLAEYLVALRFVGAERPALVSATIRYASAHR
ncbi:MAG TPA: glycosyltransferase [Stellaceae bacterium]|nr:glycosyltransferase [Stellaceae bacterium]